MDSARIAVRPLTDTRALADVGRRARLDLVFGVRHGRTEIVHAYAEPPFRVGRAFANGEWAHVILASSAPGVFGGDHLETSVRVESGARVSLRSQSSLQVHPSRDGATACIVSRYEIEAGAHLRCAWDPLIPFPDARLSQRVHIEVAGGATLFWSDALMSGRQARGERWQFGRLDHEVALFKANALAYLERYRLAPGQEPVDVRWRADVASYFGTVLAVDPHLTRASAERLDLALQEVAGVTAAADLTTVGVLLARLMSDNGPAFHSAREVCQLFMNDAP